MFNFSPEFERIPILPVSRNSPSEEPQNQPSFFHDEAHDASNTRAAELRRSEAGLGASGMRAAESSLVRLAGPCPAARPKRPPRPPQLPRGPHLQGQGWEGRAVSSARARARSPTLRDVRGATRLDAVQTGKGGWTGLAPSGWRRLFLPEVGGSWASGEEGWRWWSAPGAEVSAGLGLGLCSRKPAAVNLLRFHQLLVTREKSPDRGGGGTTPNLESAFGGRAQPRDFPAADT